MVKAAGWFPSLILYPLGEGSNLSVVAMKMEFSSLCPIYIRIKPVHEAGRLFNGALMLLIDGFRL
jgi:hypothetical protein